MDEKTESTKKPYSLFLTIGLLFSIFKGIEMYSKLLFRIVLIIIDFNCLASKSRFKPSMKLTLSQVSRDFIQSKKYGLKVCQFHFKERKS